MFETQKNIGGTSIEGHWNGLGTFDRLKMILEHPDHFLSLGLITRDELDRVMATSETEWEYVLEREEQPMFRNINLKQTTAAQILRNQFKAALKAVFN